jgi:uncharacterized protein (DUF1778 family)
MARGDPQINIRLTPDRHAILEAAAYVHRKTLARVLVEELVDEAIDRYAKLETVQKALEAQREQTATDEGKLTQLSTKRRRKASNHATDEPDS